MRIFRRLLRPTPAAALGVTCATLAALACADAPAADSNGASPLSLPPRTPVYTYEIVREYPHDKDAFTQGLEWRDGELLEGTGEVGHSNIRRVRLTSGEILQQRDLPAPHFGEGIVTIGDTLYQLTWQSGVAYSYDVKSFEPRREFRYTGEGWGLATDGTRLYMSNGSATIAVRDPATFDTLRTFTVTDNGQQIRNLNELEWVKGELWANVWTTDQIARIDPTSGAVTGWIDLKGILPASERTGQEDVLNGIAYDAAGDRVFVTGKKWRRLYEIRVVPR